MIYVWEQLAILKYIHYTYTDFHFDCILALGLLKKLPAEKIASWKAATMSGSMATLGSSCATLQDGVVYLQHMDDEQDLLRQIQDRWYSTMFICGIIMLR
jgi:hypothetical protein